MGDSAFAARLMLIGVLAFFAAIAGFLLWHSDKLI